MNNITDHIESKALDWQKRLCYEIRECILNFVPHVSESIKWEIPFFHVGKGNLCYINIRKKELVLGFYWGAKFKLGKEFLEGEGVMVKHLVFREGDQLDEAVLKLLLEEALTFI